MAAGSLGGIAKGEIEKSISHKGMEDNAMAIENVGNGMKDEISDEELEYLRQAFIRAKNENKIFLRNIILVIGWPLEKSDTEVVEEKKEESSSGFTSKNIKKKKKAKAKWSPRIRALCGGAKSVDEVYERMEAFGLLDEAPDGALDELF
jgi:hypothetical protein